MVELHQISRMANQLDAFSADGRIVLSFPESAMAPEDREDFISFAKAEWLSRQSRLSGEEADSIANDIDSAWWHRNRERILTLIGDE